MPTIPVVMMFGAIFSTGFGIAISMSQVVLADAAAAEMRGAVMALNSMMFRLAQTVGPLAAAMLLAAAGIEWVYWGAAAFGALAVVVLAVAMRR